MKSHIQFDINPMDIPKVREQLERVSQYADLWFRSAHENETLRDFCDQVGRDEKDPEMAGLVKAEIRQRRRTK